MYADGEVSAPVYDAGEQFISIPEVCLSPSGQASSQEHLQWQINSTHVVRNNTPEAVGRWVWQTDGSSLCPELQEQYSFTWGDEEQSGVEANTDSQSDFQVAPVNFGQNVMENKDIQLKEYHQPQLLKVAESAGRNTNSIPSVVPSSSETPSTSKVLDQTSKQVGKAEPGPMLHVVKYVKRQGRITKLWQCAVCSREFQHQYTLMRHLPTHTDERNYHCNICGKSFRQRSTLSQHRTTHSSERPFNCEICKKTFNRISTLISHRKTHSGNKPYKCHMCSKGFYQKGNLRNHLFTHTNERPYRCSRCGKGFNQQSNLVCHKVKVHPEEGISRSKSSPRSNATLRPASTAPISSSQKSMESTRPSTNQYKVTSNIHMKDESSEATSAQLNDFNSSNYQLSEWPFDESAAESMHQEHLPVGIIVDPIKTIHMEMAVATNQTPFALLRPEYGSPVLVKVVDTQLHGGKQLLVPASAEDLRIGGKSIKEGDTQQIRVPVVATVIPRMQSNGQLLLTIEEPHASAVLSTGSSTLALPVISSVKGNTVDTSSDMRSNLCVVRDGDRRFIGCSKDPVFGHHHGAEQLTASPPHPSQPPAPIVSPCRGLDLFDPTDCMPMGPQITAAESNETTSTDEPDIFMQLSQFPVVADSKLLQLNIQLCDSE